MAICPSPGWAQQQPERLQRADPDQFAPRRERRIEARPEVTLPAPAPSAPGEPTASLGVLAGVTITGATMYSAKELTAFYDDMLAQPVSEREITALVTAITDKYRADGYLLSRAVATPQDLRFGILNIRIYEGYIDDVVFQGAAGGQEARLQTYANALRAERPTSRETLERYVLLMNDLPGLTARPALRRINENSGAHELVVNLAFAPFEGGLAIDNKGTRTVGRHVAQLDLSFNSAFGLSDRTSVYALTVPDHTRELVFLEVQEELAIGGNGLVVGIDAWRSLIESGSRLKTSDDDSNADQIGVYAAYPLVRGQKQSLFLSSFFEIRNSEERLQGQQLFDDRVRSLRLRLRGFAADGLGGENLLTATASRGVDVLNASPRQSPTLSRTGGRPDYSKVDAEFIRWQELPGPWSAELGLRGQYAFSHLLAAEEFRAGGGKYGRAYDSSEIAGEHGFAGYLELKHDIDGSPADLENVQVYAFYDGALIRDTSPGNATFRASLASTGIGLRFTLPGGLQSTLFVAKPLTLPVFEEGADGHDLRAFYELRYRF